MATMTYKEIYTIQQATERAAMGFTEHACQILMDAGWTVQLAGNSASAVTCTLNHKAHGIAHGSGITISLAIENALFTRFQ